ncbi:uncharacterized protein LOC107708601 isoform X2 [Sinocyclocheilus rhinocerous]|uniref:uncharacterized protein LOC107708601 isoform X2 n=1 Tax=Sinocyclocheilus rhinocerous TaxID=307959 RepID=UPI0007B90C29|nr:PREDICTED: uncharacterized protein LOC107708601 isoform X2 [Sinocyclocheilus rhinocerous]
MEEEACINFKSIRAKFQEEIQVRYRPALPEKPKRLPTSAVGRPGLITMSFSSAVETKTASQPQVIVREDLKTPSGKRPVSFPSTTSGDGPNRQSLKMWHSPLVLPLSSEPKHDSSAPPPRSITSPLKFTMKPIPTPFSLTRVSVCGREIGKNGLGLVKNSGAFNVQMQESTLKTAITVMEQGGVMQSEKACKPLPDLATLGPSPSKPPRPPHVDLSKYKTGFHTSDPSEALTVESAPEAEIVATANASLEDASVPPPEFPDFDISAPEATDSNAINLAALDLEATEFPGFDSLPPPPPLPDEDDGLHLQAVLVQHCPSHFGPKQSEDALCQSLEDAGILTSATEPVTFDLRMNGSHAFFNLSAEHQLPSEPMQNSSQQKRFRESFDNVYEDVETVPRFSFAQSSYKCKGAPKNPYADNGHVKEETWRNIWHVTQWSNAAEDQNGQHDRKKLSPEHHEDKEQKKKEKQRLEKEKKEQKEKDKKRNEMHKRFKITGLEEPMYHARVLADSKLRKYDLPVKSGDLISIIRTVSCPKGKWLARDANNKYGYISVMNVELNIKEMLELGKKVSQAAGRGQTNGDDLSVSSRSSHQNPVFASSFTDDSEEWIYEDDTLSLSAENLSQIKATSMPEMFDSNSSAHHPFSDWSIEDMQTQEAESFQFADIDLLPPPALYADSL